MQKKIIALSLVMGLLLSATACSTASAGGSTGTTPTPSPSTAPSATSKPNVTIPATPDATDATEIVLSDSGSTVDGAAISTDPTAAVYTGAAIVYYEAGHDETYGEGTEADGHTAEEAAAQTVVTITQAGAYRVSGTLSAGQLAIDLGEDAESDPSAVVTLVLDNASITCTVAPALIFYNVYECGSADTETAAPTVDTSAAGANVIIADGSENHFTGSYVAKIYKEGTDKKLHKYDGAFYSKTSMNVFGETEGTGTLYIVADNEGLDSELHLTINSGTIDIQAENDGLNTNEDGVSVTTINGGYLSINAGLGAEGDGIDSNGYLVINGGTVTTLANPQTGDGGIDSDSGIYLNGGTVLALGSRNDEASTDSAQTYIQLSFASTQKSGSVVTLQTGDGNELFHYTAERDFASLTFSSADLKTDVSYSVYVDGVQQQYTGHSFDMGGGGMGGGMGGGTPPDMADGEVPSERPELPTDGTAPTDRPQRPDGSEGMTPPDGTAAPDASSRPSGGRGGFGGGETLDPSTDFTITAENKSFSGVTAVTQ